MSALALIPAQLAARNHDRLVGLGSAPPPRFVVTEPKPTIDDAPGLSFFNHIAPGFYHEMSVDFTRIFSLRCFIHSIGVPNNRVWDDCRHHS